MSSGYEHNKPVAAVQDLPLVHECKTQLRQAVKEGNLRQAENCLIELAAERTSIRKELKRLDEEGLTVLHQAVFVPEGLALLKLLVRYGGDIGVRDEEGCTLLHTAAMVGTKPIAGWLMNEGANLAALDKEGHLPMDSCSDPLLQDVIVQAMAKAGLVGLAMPSHLTWMERHDDVSDRAGDSDYGTSSSVGSLSEDEDRLSLHSTQSFSSADESTADRESPVLSFTPIARVLVCERAGSPSSPQFAASLVRVQASRIVNEAVVHHVRLESEAILRSVVPVVRRTEAGPRRAERVRIARATAGSEADSDSCFDMNQPVVLACGASEAVDDDRIVSLSPPSSSVDSRSERSPDSPAQLTASAGTPATSTASTSRVVYTSVLECDDDGAREPPTAASSGLRDTRDAPLQPPSAGLQDKVVEDVDDNNDEYLEDLDGGGSSSDETIRAVESDAESILIDVAASYSGDLVHQVITSSLDDPVNISYSSLYSRNPADKCIASALPSSFACAQFIVENWQNRQRLLSSVNNLDKHSGPLLGGPDAGPVAAGHVGQLCAEDDSSSEIADDRSCQPICPGEPESIARLTVAIASDSPVDAMETVASGVYHPAACSPSRPSSKYLLGSDKRNVHMRVPLLSRDYLGSGKAIARRNTVSEVDMGWVAPRKVRTKKSSGAQDKPLKSLLRRTSATEFDIKEHSPGGGNAGKLARKKSVSFPAEVLLADAVHDGDIDEVRSLVETGAIAVDALLGDGLTPLHSAVLERQREIVKMLLAHGARVAQRDGDGWTALHAAASEGTVPVTHLLLENGADPWVKTSKDKKTAYELASNDNVRLVLSKAMGEAYRSISLVQPGTTADSESSVDSSDGGGGDNDAAEQELEESDIDESDGEDEREKDVRVRDSDVEDNSSDRDDDDDDDESDADGDDDSFADAECTDATPTDESSAPARSKLEISPSSSHAARDDKPASKGIPPPKSLAEAVACSDLAAMELLIEDASQDDLTVEVDSAGNTLLHAAAHTGHVEIIERLLDFGLKPSVVNKAGKSPLDVAANREAKHLLLAALSRHSRRSYSTAI